MIREHYLLVAALICAIAVSGFLHYHSQPPSPHSATSKPSETGFDHFVEIVDLTQWKTDGQPGHYLTATRMEHFPSRQYAILTSPQLHTDSDHDPYWNIRADTARLPDSGSVIQLDNHVVLTTHGRPGIKRVLTTEQMLVDTRLNHAYSNAPVRIESNSGIVAGTGFHADLNSQRMALHHQVRSRHEERDK